MEVLVVVDMQNDFIDGALGSAMAQAIVPNVIDKIKHFDGLVLATRDTHFENYMETQEGYNLPVPHCIKGTKGHEINREIAKLIKTEPIDKLTFGSVELATKLKELDAKEHLDKVTFIGLCTDICVISNAMVTKAFMPELPIAVDAKCCAGVTEESHLTALSALKACQIAIENA